MVKSKTSEFLKLQDAILDLQIPANKRLLLIKMQKLTSKQGYAFCSNDYLEEFMDLSDRQIQNILKSLEDDGYINRDTVNTSQNTKKRKIYICADKILGTQSISVENNIESLPDKEIIDPEPFETNIYTFDSMVKDITDNYNYATADGIKHTRNNINKICKEHEVEVKEIVKSYYEHYDSILDAVDKKDITGASAMRYIVAVTFNKINEPVENANNCNNANTNKRDKQCIEFDYNTLSSYEYKFNKFVELNYGVDLSVNTEMKNKIDTYFDSCNNILVNDENKEEFDLFDTIIGMITNGESVRYVSNSFIVDLPHFIISWVEINCKGSSMMDSLFNKEQFERIKKIDINNLHIGKKLQQDIDYINNIAKSNLRNKVPVLKSDEVDNELLDDIFEGEETRFVKTSIGKVNIRKVYLDDDDIPF